MSSVEEIYVTAIGGTGAVAGTAEQQTLTLSGSTNADVTFLGISTNVLANSNTSPTAIATELAAATLSNEAKALGITGITSDGAVLTLTYDEDLGDVGNLPSQATSGNTAFTAASEKVKGVAPIAAQGGDVTVDAANYTGVTQVWSDRSTQDLTVTNLTEDQVVGIEGNGNVTNGNVTADYKAAATKAGLAVDGGTTAGDYLLGATSAAVAEFTVTSTGEKNTIGTVDLSSNGAVKTLDITATTDLTTGDLTIADTETVNISGAGFFGATTATDGANNVVTINASENSGGVDLDLGNNAKDVTVTGGSGDDRIDFDDALDGSDTVNLGAGTDTVAVAAAVVKKDFDNVTNVERVEFTSTGVTQDLSILKEDGISTFVYSNGTGNLAPTNDEDSFTHIITATTTDFTPGVATQSDSNVMNVELVDADITGTNGELGNASGGAATTYESINLTSSKAADGSLTGTNVIDSVDMAAGGDLNISGDAKMTISGSVNGINVDASELSASLDFTGSSANADTVIGTNEADTFDLQDGANTITTSGGGDSLVYGADGGLTVTDFTVGAGSEADTLIGDLSEIAADSALTGAVALLGDGGNIGNGDSGSIVTADGPTDITNSTGNILAVSGTYDTAAEAGATLEAGGVNEITHDIVDDEGFMMLFTDGTDTFLAAVDHNETADNTEFASGDLGEEVLVTLSGISDLESFADTNFSFQS